MTLGQGVAIAGIWGAFAFALNELGWIILLFGFPAVEMTEKVLKHGSGKTVKPKNKNYKLRDAYEEVQQEGSD